MYVITITNYYTNVFIFFDTVFIDLQSFLLKPLAHLFFKNLKQGAQTSIYCAVSEEMEGVSGKYLADCRIQKLKGDIAEDDEVAERLWELSAQMVGLQ